MTDRNISLHALAISLSLAAMPATALAEEAGEGAQTRADVVVTAFRTPVEYGRVTSSVTILDEAAIRSAQPVALTDILVRTPGLSVSRNGGYGTVSTLRLRGAGGGQSLVVMDGIRLLNPTAPDAAFDFSSLFIDDIDRIEILRGPQSILWGSSTIGGVINLRSRQATAPLEGSFRAEAGSNRTVNAQAGLAGTGESIDWRLSGSTFTTDGVSARNDGGDDDGYTRRAAQGGATIRLNNMLSLDLRGHFVDGRTDFDAFLNPHAYSRSETRAGYAGLTAQLLDGRFVSRIAILQDDTDQSDHNPDSGTTTREAEGRVRRYEYQGTLTLDPVQVVIGAEREEARMDYDSFGRVIGRADTDSVYGQVRVDPVAGVSINGGVRHDEHSLFGGSTVWSAGAVWTVPGTGTRLRGGYDEGFRAPSLYQLYSDFRPATGSLRPERAYGWEFAIEQRLAGDAILLSAAYFTRTTTNLLDFVSCPFAPPFPAECFVPGTTDSRFGYYANVGRAQTNGLELTASAALGRFSVAANYSLVDAEDRSPGSARFGQQLVRVPRETANADLAYTHPFGLTAGLGLRYVSSVFDGDFSPNADKMLGDYVLADIRAEWAIAPDMSLFGRVENITDERYETAGGFSTLGRTVHIGLRGRFR